MGVTSVIPEVSISTSMYSTDPITRKELVEYLEELLSDEFDSSELVYETDNQLIRRMRDAAFFYKDKWDYKDVENL
jgi:hypothetical protein